jgi:hypothetical protein
VKRKNLVGWKKSVIFTASKLNNMKKLLKCVIGIVMSLLPQFVHAQEYVPHTDTRPGTVGINLDLFKQNNDNSTHYVNTKAPGVHKEYDEKYGTVVWKDGMGSFLCRDENMKPITDMDKNVFFNGDQSSPYVRKEWDSERNCYVWRSTNGDFLGRDKPSNQQTDKWVNKKDTNWLQNGKTPKGKESDESKKHKAEMKKALAQWEKEQQKAQQQTQRETQKVDDEAIALQKKNGGQHLEDVDYAQVEQLLNKLDALMNKMDSKLSFARQKLSKYEMLDEYGGLINNAKSCITRYRQRRQSTRDPVQMLRGADALLNEAEQHLGVVRSALQKEGTMDRYGSMLNELQSGIQQFRSERQRIRL